MLRKKTFRGGAHPPEEKHWTENKPIETLPLPERVIIPLQQHIGAPASACVAVGDQVKKGQVIKAVVVRVNSPGGGVAASHEIYREIVRIRDEGTPVVVSMGSLAASGGYYIAVEAEKILV